MCYALKCANAIRQRHVKFHETLTGILHRTERNNVKYDIIWVTLHYEAYTGSAQKQYCMV